MIETIGDPDIFNEGNEVLMDTFVDLWDGTFDDFYDRDIKEELIIRLHQYDDMRRLKLYSSWQESLKKG